MNHYKTDSCLDGWVHYTYHQRRDGVAYLMLPKLVYIHIGKTAGTSLRMALEKAFGPGKVSQPFVQKIPRWVAIL